MINRLLKSVVLGVLFASSFEAMAQTAVLVNLNGVDEEKKYVVEENGKIFFSDNKMFIEQMASNAPVSFDLSAIAKVRFQPASNVGVESIFSDGGELFLYPNPATDQVFLANVSEKTAVSIFSIDGALVKKAVCSQKNGISVADLSNGFYLVKAGNQTFKLEKK